MARNVSIVILAEDMRQAQLVRHFLLKRNFDGGIRLEISPRGKQCGFQFVLDKYPSELTALRKRNARGGLVAVIDADQFSVEERDQQMTARLSEAQVSPLSEGECVAILVPRRNVDTWIHFLRGNTVNESNSFKAQVTDSDVKLAAAKLSTDCPSQLPTTTPASLQRGCKALNEFRQCVKV